MFYKIRAVFPLDEYTLLVEFQDAQKKLYDVKPPFAKWPVFEALRQTHGLFQQVKVDTGGYGVVWNDAIDLSCNELYELGKVISADKSANQPLTRVRQTDKSSCIVNDANDWGN